MQSEFMLADDDRKEGGRGRGHGRNGWEGIERCSR